MVDRQMLELCAFGEPANTKAKRRHRSISVDQLSSSYFVLLLANVEGELLHSAENKNTAEMKNLSKL